MWGRCSRVAANEFGHWVEGTPVGRGRPEPRGEGVNWCSEDGCWFVWASRMGFGFRLDRVEVQVYFYGRGSE